MPSKRNGTIPRTCIICGTPFMAWPYQVQQGKDKYCSHPCYSIGRIRNVTMTCEQCQQAFTVKPNLSDSRFCSRKCFKESLKKREVRSCQQCGTSFETLTSGKQRFCSPICKGMASRADADVTFWSHIQKGENPDDCWLWTGYTSAGYGQFEASGKVYGAHRFSLELKLGRPLAKGMMALHTCPRGDNRWCTNWLHLREGTAVMNYKDARDRGQAPVGENHYLRKFPEKSLKGERHPQAKLTESAVREIRTAALKGARITELAQQFGISPATVGYIIHRRTWKHVA